MAEHDDDRTYCIACDKPLVAGDLYYSDLSGGFIHADCCGPERESYTGPDEEPLKPGEPIPEPNIWVEEPPRPAKATPGSLVGRTLEALLALAYAADVALDDGEELEDGSHKLDKDNSNKLCDAVEKLAALPDDRPGYTMGPAAKARWALRSLVGKGGAS